MTGNEVIGTIYLFGGGFAPRSTAYCQGGLLAINQNQSLFSILGTTFGGDGRTTFGLPDLASRSPKGTGNGAGLSNCRLGQKGGADTNSLDSSQLPSHSHTASFTPTSVDPGTFTPPTMHALGVNATSADPTGNMLADGSAGGRNFAPESAGTPATMSPTSIQGGSFTGGATNGTVTVNPAGNSSPFSITSPYLGVNYIMILEGIYPSRS